MFHHQQQHPQHEQPEQEDMLPVRLFARHILQLPLEILGKDVIEDAALVSQQEQRHHYQQNDSCLRASGHQVRFGTFL